MCFLLLQNLSFCTSQIDTTYVRYRELAAMITKSLSGFSYHIPGFVTLMFQGDISRSQECLKKKKSN